MRGAKQQPSSKAKSSGGAVGEIFGIVVGAGSGERFGRLKQLDLLCGKSVLQHSLTAAANACDAVVAVVPDALVEQIVPEGKERSDELSGKQILVTAGGSTRAESVRCGIRALRAQMSGWLEGSIAVVHDAARPLATQEIFQQVIAAVKGGADAAVPVTEVTDTIRHTATGPVDRSLLRAVQTPQAFKAEMLEAAHAESPEATDDATLVEAIGGKVVLIEGDPGNIKITRPRDLAVAEVLLQHLGD